jgi:hypothetical protein
MVGQNLLKDGIQRCVTSSGFMVSAKKNLRPGMQGILNA